VLMGVGENLIPPTNERSTLELFSQGSDPWRVIDGYASSQCRNNGEPSLECL
jgi:cleavage and polyadenylation specificity factor subunit 1